MGRKSNKEKAVELLKKLNKDELREILDSFDLGNPDNTYEKVEGILKKQCPNCGSEHHIRKGKNNIGLTTFMCKDCGRRFNILSNTPLEKTQYDWNVWVYVLRQMFMEQSLNSITENLITDDIVDHISEVTVSAMCNKLRDCFKFMPLPQLEGVIQVDEKYFKENQKSSHKVIDVLDTTGTSTRIPHKRATPSKYGTMGPEFATVCCAVDNHGHSIAKVVCMGKMFLEDFEYHMGPHLNNITYLCTDMNEVYTQYASINHVPHYLINSRYHTIIKKCDTKSKLNAAYKKDKLDYIEGVGTLTYKMMCDYKKKHELSIARVNNYHSFLEDYINRTSRGVSTKHLQAWVSFFNYKRNFLNDNKIATISYEHAEIILIELLKLRISITVDDIKNEVDGTKRQPRKYTKKFIEKTVNARIKSNNPYIKFSSEDGVPILDKKYCLKHMPTYKIHDLAKSLGIKPFSPIAVDPETLKKKILAHPDFDDYLYVLAYGRIEDE